MLQRKICKIFKGLPNTFGIADDILIAGHDSNGVVSCRVVWLIELVSLTGIMSRGNLLCVCMMYCNAQLLVFRFFFLCNT